MNYIYDLILNYNKELYEFYEWNNTDKLINIEKIPIIRINNTSFNEIMSSRIKISLVLLDKIKNKTYTRNKIIKYSLLITNLNRVIALKFDDQGIEIERSSLLLDEEEDVLEDDYQEEKIEYEIIEKLEEDYFLTRKEKSIKKYLLKEINNLYMNNNYEELNYLYEELYNDDKSIKERYNYLINSITNNYNSNYEKLYNIIKLANKKELNTV